MERVMVNIAAFTGWRFGMPEKVGLLAAGVVAAASAAYLGHRLLRSSEGGSSNDIPARTVVELLDLESMTLMRVTPAITTVTFFEGDADAAEAHLRARVQAVLHLNPWLQGTLTQGRHTLVRLSYLSAAQQDSHLAPGIFCTASDPWLDHEALEYTAMKGRLQPYCVGAGAALMDAPLDGHGRPPPLFKVTLIRTSTAGSKYAVVVSLSHVIADGHTFYSLYGMLSLSEQPRALKVDRHHCFLKDLEAVLAPNDTYSWMTGPGCTLNILWHLLAAPTLRCLLQAVPQAWVEGQKEKARCDEEEKDSHSSSAAPLAPACRLPFVSTNDVVTTTLLSLSGCDVGVMPVNFRGRVATRTTTATDAASTLASCGAHVLTDDHAGNYEGFVAYNAPDFASPALLRQSLGVARKGIIRRARGDVPFPGFFASIAARIALVTSWATFYRDMVLPAAPAAEGSAGGVGAAAALPITPTARQLYHVPLIEHKGLWLGDLFVLFRPRSGELHVLALTRSLDAAALRRAFD